MGWRSERKTERFRHATLNPPLLHGNPAEILAQPFHPRVLSNLGRALPSSPAGKSGNGSLREGAALAMAGWLIHSHGRIPGLTRAALPAFPRRCQSEIHKSRRAKLPLLCHPSKRAELQLLCHVHHLGSSDQALRTLVLHFIPSQHTKQIMTLQLGAGKTKTRL